MAKNNFALIAAERPKKRRAPAPLDDNPIVRAKVRYITTRIGMYALAEEFKGLPGCTYHNLAHLSAKEDWPEQREKHYDRVAAEAANAIGLDEAKRHARHVQSASNVMITSDGLLAGIHKETQKVLQLQESNAITAHGAVSLLKGLATALRNIAIAQTGMIMLEQQLASTEGSSFQKLAEAAEAKWQEVVDRRNELVKQAEDRAKEAKRAEKRKRGGGDDAVAG